jgi:hypothetical protein
MSSLKAKGELADKVTGKGGDEEKLSVNEPVVVSGSTQTLPTAQVELMLVSDALKIVSCGLAKVTLKLL